MSGEDAPSAKYRIEALTGRVFGGGARIGLPYRSLEICMALATHDRELSSAKLGELLFPEADAWSAQGKVRVYMHRLRTRLPGAVERRFGSYRLSEQVEVDLERIGGLVYGCAAAVRPDVTDLLDALRRLYFEREHAPFERWSWFEPIAGRIAQVAADAAQRVLECELEHDDLIAAAGIARAALEQDPIDESAVRLLVHALAALGRRAQAMRSFAQYERALRLELHVSPPAQLHALAAGSALH